MPVNVKVLAFRVDDNYAGAHYCSDVPRALVLARNEDHAIAVYCEFSGADDGNFFYTSCECCAPVNINISGPERLTREELAEYVDDDYRVVICAGE